MTLYSLSMTIMAHPKRREHVTKMVRRLGEQTLVAINRGVPVSDVTVVWDTESQGPWWCAREAWKRASQTVATHHLVIQDDVVFCADLPEAVLRLVHARPSSALSLFLPRDSVATAVQKNLRWVATRRFLWAQAVVLPVWMAEWMLRWIDVREQRNPDWKSHDDVRMADFFTARGGPVYVPVPNLVEHIGDELGSIMGHYGSAARRRARAFVGIDSPARDIDWNRLEAVLEWKR